MPMPTTSTPASHGHGGHIDLIGLGRSRSDAAAPLLSMRPGRAGGGDGSVSAVSAPRRRPRRRRDPPLVPTGRLRAERGHARVDGTVHLRPPGCGQSHRIFRTRAIRGCTSASAGLQQFAIVPSSLGADPCAGCIAEILAGVGRHQV